MGIYCCLFLFLSLKSNFFHIRNMVWINLNIDSADNTFVLFPTNSFCKFGIAFNKHHSCAACSMFLRLLRQEREIRFKHWQWYVFRVMDSRCITISPQIWVNILLLFLDSFILLFCCWEEFFCGISRFPYMLYFSSIVYDLICVYVQGLLVSR